MPPGRPWDFQNSLSEIPKYPFPHSSLFQRGRELFSKHGINISTWNLGLSVFGTKQKTESGNRAFLYAQGVDIRLQYLTRRKNIVLCTADFRNRFLEGQVCYFSSVASPITVGPRKSGHLPTLHGSPILLMC